MIPLLVLGLDGPLNPYLAEDTKLPDGYDTWYLDCASDAHAAPAYRWALEEEKGVAVRLNPAHGSMLLTLVAAGLVELAWASAWNEDANILVAPVLGLPALATIPMPLDDRRWTTSRMWKRDTVEAACAGRALAWIDAPFVEPADFVWAAERTAAGSATLLRPVDPRIGLVQGDIDAVATWAAGLATRPGALPAPGAHTWAAP